MSPKQIAARRKGGLAFKAKYGTQGYQELGRKGGLTESPTRGRPRLKTLTEIMEARAQQIKINERRYSNEAVLKRALELTAGRAG
ncbi:MAG: hypothetical protein RBS96_09005 [Dehalococcoidales bacterium]|nr:hypothetical protein [Dehalococcoidales bacterium]